VLVLREVPTQIWGSSSVKILRLPYFASYAALISAALLIVHVQSDIL